MACLQQKDAGEPAAGGVRQQRDGRAFACLARHVIQRGRNAVQIPGSSAEMQKG